VLQAGKNKLTLDEIVRLHTVMIEETRFTRAGLRPDGVFLGERDHQGDPLPEFIGARPDDLQTLMQGLISANERMSEMGLDTLLQAAATAFGFVYIHPLQDGSGRLHRCLIHHVLAERKFTPPGMVFPVSPVMLDRIDNYRDTLGAKALQVDARARSLESVDAELNRISGERRVVLTASGPTQPAWESSRFGHGFLAFHLIEALRGPAEIREGDRIGLLRLLDYVSHRVADAASQIRHEQHSAIQRLVL
jgi:hypothetical protein